MEEEVAEAPARGPDLTTVHPPDRGELERFLGRLGALARGDEQLVAGHLHLLGLERIRDRLGDRWPRHAITAQKAAMAIIERHLDAGDFFVRHGELSFLIVFAHLRVAAARERCRRMAVEIGTLLMGEDFDAQGEIIATSVFTDDGSLLRRLVTGVAGAVPGVAALARPAATDSLPELDGQAMIRGLRVRYVPVWEVTRRAVTTYFAVPVADGFFGRTVRDHEARLHMHGFLPDLAFDLEVARLGIADLVRSVLRGQQTLLCWQVDYETLATRRGREIYLGLLHQMPKQAQRLLVLELTGFTDAVPPARLAEIAGLLRPCCRFLIARVAPEFSRMDVLAECQFRIVGTTFHGSGPARARQTAAFVAHAAQARLRSYAAGLSSADEVAAALDAGCDLVTRFDAGVMADQPGRVRHIDLSELRTQP
jgi:hypothetical protein